MEERPIGVDEKEANVRNELKGQIHGGVFTAMSSGYRDDRPALIVVALIVLACVVGWVFDAAGKHQSCYQVATPGNYSAEQQYQGQAEYAEVCTTDYEVFGDTVPQWTMAFLALAATIVSIWGIQILRDTLEQSRLAAVAATKAAVEATKSNAIMLADQRPWISLAVTPTILSYRDESDTLMLSLRVKLANKGKAPAIDMGMFGSAKILTKGSSEGVMPEDYSDLRREVVERAISQSEARSGWDEVLFQEESRTIPEHCIHAHLKSYGDVSEVEGITLIAAFAVAYSYGGKHGGAFWTAIITPAEGRTLFAHTVKGIKTSPTVVQALPASPVMYF